MSRRKNNARRRPRKFLNCTQEEFFVSVLNIMGPPEDWRPHPEVYISASKFGRERLTHVRCWLDETVEGAQFRAVVAAHGEAKGRAYMWLMRYLRWHNKLLMEQINQQIVQNAQELRDYALKDMQIESHGRSRYGR